YRSGGVPTYYGGFAVQVTPGTQAYAGFQFQAADGIHYGWVQLAVSANGTTSIIDFTNAAYNTTPGAPINAGVPEPGTMALLAMGATAILGAAIKRRRG
ncbi:MAG: PEP-CTERM sorting domain-containing protein, partial [Verrucomicrobiota bacterium]